MLKNKSLRISAIAILLLLIVGLFFRTQESYADILSGICFFDTKYNIELNPCYDGGDDIYYLYLPSYLTAEDVQISSSKNKALFFPEVSEAEIKTLGGVPLSQNITMCVQSGKRESSAIIQILQCKNLPTVYIETQSHSTNYVNANKTNKEAASVTIVNADGSLDYKGDTILSGTGNSTWQAVKKPYKLKFNTAESLLGGAKTTQWRLLANYSDYSSMRNTICYTAANDIGIAYTSKLEYVALFLNGSYNGLYNIGTKSAYEPDCDTLPAVFEMSVPGLEYDYKTPNGSLVIFHHGSSWLIKEKVNAFAKALSSSDYAEVEACCDTLSFAKKYLLEENLANFDNRLSQLFAVNSSGKIEAISAWDYDLSLGVTWDLYMDNVYNASVMRNIWYKILWKYPEFRSLVIELANEYESVFTENITDTLAETYELIENDFELDKLRWQSYDDFFDGRTYLQSTANPTTLLEHTEYIGNFMEKRMAFLKEYRKNPDAYCTLSFFSPDGSEIGVFYPKGQSFNPDYLQGGILTVAEFAPDADDWYSDDGVALSNIDIFSQDLEFHAVKP